MLRPIFNERKAAQVAHLLLRLRGGRMSYIKLLKLMYYVERTALIEWGRPVTFDRIVAMDHGMVLSETLNMITGGLRPERYETWRQFVSEPAHYEVSAEDVNTDYDELSDAEENL